jgi:hypothetical protein
MPQPASRRLGQSAFAANLRIAFKWADYHLGARLGTAVQLRITFNLFVLSLALFGCGIAPRVHADDETKQQASVNARLIEQSKAAMAACDAEFPAGEPKTAVVRRKCINDGFAIRLPTFGPDQDLVQTVMADSMVIAEQVQSGKMTIAEGNAAISEKWSKAVTESQRRANSKNSVLAQQSAAAGGQNPVAPANGAAVTPVDLPGFTCTQNGNMTTCN